MCECVRRCQDQGEFISRLSQETVSQHIGHASSARQVGCRSGVPTECTCRLQVKSGESVLYIGHLTLRCFRGLLRVDGNSASPMGNHWVM